MGLLIGASMGQDDLTTYPQMLAGNNIMRIFPSTWTTNNALKVLPPWTDSRFTYCQTNGVIPFVSTKVDGNTDGIAYVKTQLTNMPSWITTLYITDRHEPEADVTAAAYQSNFNAFLAMINSLDPAIRARIKCGPILTKTYTEKAGTTRDYGDYDPGTGDFFGVDMYVESGTASAVVTPATIPSAATFLAKFLAYKKSTSDARPRIFPELGLIGMPDDTDGSARAAWLQSIYNTVKTWKVGASGWTQPWSFIGFLWWHSIGKATGEVFAIGERRDFPLHLRTVAGTRTGSGTTADPYLWDSSTVVTLPGSPPAPVATFNAIYNAENGTAIPPIAQLIGTVSEVDGARAVTASGGVPNTPASGNVIQPADLPPAARLMAADYTVLITDKNLNVLGDPISVWTMLDITLRFNEPTSSMFTSPGYAWIRNQIVPGARVVCIRSVLGTTSVVAAGPIEEVLYERSDDGDNSGDGVLTVNWTDDLAWIAGRLTYPDPTKTPETQNTDNWLWSGNAELGMRALVDGNAGPSALAIRQVPRLALGAIASVGNTINITADDAFRFIACTDALRTMAQRGGNLGFRTRQSMTQNLILFEVYSPTDRSGSVRFSFGLGNLKYLAYDVTAPEVNATIVGGQGTGADRYVMERNDPISMSSWGRLETLTSRPGNDATIALQEDGDSALADGGEGVRLSSNAADTVDCRYGVHYDLGDLVSIEVWSGYQVTDVIATVHIQAYPTAGEVVGITIGDQSTSHDYGNIDRLRSIDRRVGSLERNTLPYKPATT